MSLALKNCKILKNKLISTDVLIEKGKISKIGRIKKADREIDCDGNIILPGLIDPHVHMREPGLTYKEGFVTGSKAALKGGVTTFLDMPNTKPPVLTVKDLQEKRKIAKKCAVNYGFHFGVSSNNLTEIKKAKNIASVKIFLNESTGNLKVDNIDIVKAVIKNTRITCFHAEESAVKTVLDIYTKYKHDHNKIYFCHISKKMEIDMKKGDAYFEVTPHHLFLTKSDEKRLKGFGLMKPGLAKKSDQNALWKGIKNKKVDTVGTDHAPHTIEEKKSKNPPFGVPGIETMLPLLLNAVNKKKIKIIDIQRLCCENPAKIFKIKNKGKIKVGYDADLTLVNLKGKTKIDNKSIVSKCKWSPWHGKVLKGSIEMTIVNGLVGYKQGKFYKTHGKEVTFG
ncbi:dihydroorotase family protein [Nanoarchaeota archaeon]